VEVQVNWNGAMTFVGRSGTNHSVVMDTSPEHGGHGSAPSPMEMVLMGFAGCSGIDVVSILKKKRQTFDKFDMRISGERGDEHPRVFTTVKAEYIFTGTNLSQKHFEDAVRLSVEKYCSVAGMVAQTATIDWSVILNEPEQG